MIGDRVERRVCHTTEPVAPRLRPVAAPDLQPGDRIRALVSDADHEVWTVRLVDPVHDNPVWTHAVVCDESPYHRYLAHAGTEFVLATADRERAWRAERTNRAAEFLPGRAPGELPALRVGDAVVTAYWRDDGLRVAVDTSDVREPRGGDSPPAGGGAPAPPVDSTALDLFRRIKTLERADGSWPGAEIVPLLCAWFAEQGLDPDGQEG